jgi:DNA (cytosine-5)-methyltransferase 1
MTELLDAVDALTKPAVLHLSKPVHRGTTRLPQQSENRMKSGELFAGVGGLGMAVDAVFGSRPAWFAEFDKAPSKVLEYRHPEVTNYGDVTQIDWAAVERPNILAGGFPCQDVSLAGRRRGMKTGTRSGLWSEFAQGIDILRPDWVVIENVRGLLSADAASEVEPCPWCLGDDGEQHALRALGAVLGDLAELGFDAEWTGLRASDIGAPHGRFRVFILAWPTAHTTSERRPFGGTSGSAPGSFAVASDRDDASLSLLPTPTAKDSAASGGSTPSDAQRGGGRSAEKLLPGMAREHATEWGPYTAAVERWERVTGRRAPSPVRHDGRDGNPRLNPELTEWMMGWPASHVTDPIIGLTRAEQLKACGNGVVPQQAEAALRELLTREGVPSV